MATFTPDLYVIRLTREASLREAEKKKKKKAAKKAVAKKVASALRKRPGTGSTTADPQEHSSAQAVMPIVSVARDYTDALGSLTKHAAIEKTADIEAVDTMPKKLQKGKALTENRKLHYRRTFQDLPISVENRPGSVRRGFDKDGTPWATKMKFPYGYIPGTEGTDGDALDVFVGPDENAAYAYVVHSLKPDTGAFDEDKVMLGFPSAERAEEVFKQHYDDPGFFGGIARIPMWRFHKIAFVKKHTTDKLVASVRRDLGTGSRLCEMGLVYDPADTGVRKMKKSILGHHRAEQTEPMRREAGVKGMKWGKRKAKDRPQYKMDFSRAKIADAPPGSPSDLSQALRTENLHLGSRLRSGDWSDEEKAKARERIEQNNELIAHYDSQAEASESGFMEHGVKGMKWGQRKDRRAEGTATIPEREKRSFEDEGKFKEAAEKLYKRQAEMMGHDPDKVQVKLGLQTFTVGDKLWTKGGEADLTSGQITFWPDAINSGVEMTTWKPAEVNGIVAHEVAHVKFQKFLEAYYAERDKAAKDTREPDTVSGKIKTEYESEYPIQTALWDSYGLNAMKMYKEDGVSDYSKAYWDDWNKGKIRTDLAMHETIAEMARIEAATGKLPGSRNWKRFYKAAMKFTGKKKIKPEMTKSDFDELANELTA